MMEKTFVPPFNQPLFSPQYGWVCPVCRNVMSPLIPCCNNCKSNKSRDYSELTPKEASVAR